MVVGCGPDIATLTITLKSHPSDWFGPFLFNVSINCFGFGLLCSQVWTYFMRSRKDALWIKRLVAVVFVLSALTLARTFVFVLYQNILGFGDWENAVGRNRWGFYLDPVTLTSTTVQSFFGWRCYSLTKRNGIVLGVLATAILSVLGFAIAIAIQLALDPFDVPAINRLAIPVLILSTVLDAAITLIVSYKLISSRNRFNPNTDTLVNKLLATAWESASPPCIMQMINLAIAKLVTPMWVYTGNTLTIWLYVFSLMHTLNSRSNLRKTQNGMIEGYSQEWGGPAANNEHPGIPLTLAHTHQPCSRCEKVDNMSAAGPPVRKQHDGKDDAPLQSNCVEKKVNMGS